MSSELRILFKVNKKKVRANTTYFFNKNILIKKNQNTTRFILTQTNTPLTFLTLKKTESSHLILVVKCLLLPLVFLSRFSR